MNTSTAAMVVPLHPWDELFHSIHSQYGGTGSGAAVLLVRGIIESGPLREALACLQARHPKLRATIVAAAGGRHAFAVAAEPAPIPFEVKDFPTANLPWQEESERLLESPLNPATDPLTRVLVLRARERQRCVLIVKVHHALGDGQSILRLLHDLLDYYAAVERGAPPVVEPLAIPTAPHARWTGGWKRLLHPVRLFRHRRANRHADWTWLPGGGDAPPRRLWDHFVFTERETAAFAQRCRREGTTLYGALYAGAARALVMALDQPTARFRCRVPIDMRDLLTSRSGPITSADLGNFSAGFEAVYDVDRESAFWPLARRARADLQAFAAAGGPSLIYNLIRLVRLPYVPPTLRRGSMLVNSYGVVTLRDRYGNLSADELSIVFNNVTAGPSLLIQGFVVQRRLNVSLSMVEVPERFWTHVRDAIRNGFQEAIHGERNDKAAIPA